MSRDGSLSGFGREHVREVRNVNRQLLEKALRMRCVSFFADMKSDLLMSTIKEFSQSKTIVVAANTRILSAQEQVQKLAVQLAEKTDQLEDQKAELEIRVEQRTRELEAQAELSGLQRELAQRAATRAEEMNRLKGSFLANMSHEVRTPLTAILGFADLLRTRSTDETSRSFAERITDNGHRLLATINGILDLARLESGQDPVQLAAIDLVKEARDTIKLLESLAVLKGLKLNLNVVSDVAATKSRDATGDTNEIEKNLSDSKVWICAEPSMLRKALNNVIGNALKFTDFGSVTVEVGLDLSGRDRFGLVRVLDTGVGISEDFIPMLFEEFRQESSGTQRKFGGTGLGLALTKKFFDLLGGDVSVKSQKGSGTIVELRLPLCTPPENAFLEEVQNSVSRDAEIDSLVKGQNSSLRKVLLVEDDQWIRELFGYYLDQTCDLSMAASGEEAIDQASDTNFDLVIMDVNLGRGMDGIQTLELLRKIGGYSKVPVVAVTAYAMSGDREKLLGQGFNDYLSKPVSQETLQRIVKETKFPVAARLN